MQSHLIDFESLPWTDAAKGLRYKAYKNGSQQIRLAEFYEGFLEKDWCLKGHAGYVLEGCCMIDFNGVREQFKKGNLIFIPAGGRDKHKLHVNTGEKVLFLLFETI